MPGVPGHWRWVIGVASPPRSRGSGEGAVSSARRMATPRYRVTAVIERPGGPSRNRHLDFLPRAGYPIRSPRRSRRESGSTTRHRILPSRAVCGRVRTHRTGVAAHNGHRAWTPGCDCHLMHGVPAVSKSIACRRARPPATPIGCWSGRAPGIGHRRWADWSQQDASEARSLLICRESQCPVPPRYLDSGAQPYVGPV